MSLPPPSEPREASVPEEVRDAIDEHEIAHHNDGYSAAEEYEDPVNRERLGEEEARAKASTKALLTAIQTALASAAASGAAKAREAAIRECAKIVDSLDGLNDAPTWSQRELADRLASTILALLPSATPGATTQAGETR